MAFALTRTLTPALLAAWLWTFPALAAQPATIGFNRQVRPMLAEICFACHGPDKNQRKAKLRLDLREVAIEREAIVPGKPDQSKLVEHIFSNDPDEIMPPPKTHKTLSARQKAILKQWVAEGAAYEPHWAYIPLARPAVPAVPGSNWIGNPIDAFVLQLLKSKQIEPSRPAGKRQLLRRLSLDLVGLPPTPAEVDDFLADDTPQAYERQVDRLLRSPHFGERMAVPWLDVVRYADTVGYHGDQNQRIFPYRDYVIDSFNRNKPFDQFTVEQLAGDLLPDPSIDALVGSGFNRLNMMTREGGAQPKEYMARYAADRVRTVSMAWLGSTMGCAECHDHKFDPFSTRDFYQMEAYFADLKQWGVYMDYSYTPNPDLRGFSNDHPFPPEIEVDSPYLQRRLEGLQRNQDALAANLARGFATNQQARAAYESWRSQSLAFLKQAPDGWITPAPEVALRMKDTNAVPQTNFTVHADRRILFSDLPKENLKVSLSLPPGRFTAIRLEITPHEGSGEKRMKTKRRNGTAITLSAVLKRPEAKDAKLPFYFADADHKQERFANGAAILGVRDLWSISTEHENQTAVWVLDKPLESKSGDILVIDLGNLGVASARVSISPFAAQNPLKSGAGDDLRRVLARKLPRQKDLVLAGAAYLRATHGTPELLARARQLDRDIRECRNGRAASMVSGSQQPVVIRVLPRGNWQDESGEVVSPAPPHFLPQPPNPDGRRLTRLDLARWLVSAENPLTARTVMNRLWKQFFGAGISAVVDDLGAQGEWPIQPELLDWLACEFMRPSTPAGSARDAQTPHAWDVKHMVKLMVMSSTYRQDSNQRPDLKELDPNNRWLACQSPRRLEAEFVRDNALAIAGLLNEEIGGPSAHPYQPAGYYANLQFPDRDYYADQDERQYRRGVYAHWQRTFLQPMLANFDAPAREECAAARVVSNTPQQALTLLNDPTFVEAARVLAARLLAAPRTDQARLEDAFQRALSRSPRAAETQSLLRFLAVQRDYYQSHDQDSGKLLKIGNAAVAPQAGPGELAAWTQVCRVILNLQETITRY
jgi:hypothetical protein